MSYLNPLKIESSIYIIRSQKVMMDSDLASLYGVSTKVLNQAIKRNHKRFPLDFMFKINAKEYTNLRSQFVTSSLQHGGRRNLPYAFTENGIAMLSSVLSSERAIQVNITIIRVFTKLRKLLRANESIADKVQKIKKVTLNNFQIIFDKLDEVQEEIYVLKRNTPPLCPKRKKIGLIRDKK
ncbi:MAG: ORF6N domain-containing protein [Bacteriovoracaceae bacterium]|nr:ORF6N domain-containing protein [Bacteriovoracaceae bacterium]